MPTTNASENAAIKLDKEEFIQVINTSYITSQLLMFNTWRISSGY